MSPRYAVYWAPEPDHPLWAAGCAWLGRAADGGPGSALAGRAAPWRYGFHATLKPPLHLAAGRDAHAFDTAVGALAATLAPIALPPLQVAVLGDFVALRPAHTPADLQHMADRCVRELDAFRRPADAEETQRRSAGLDDEQRALLQRWGYPHVFGRWRFHLTLSDPLENAAAQAAVQRDAAAFFAPALALPLGLQSICVFEEAAPGQAMTLRSRHPLGGAVRSLPAFPTLKDTP